MKPVQTRMVGLLGLVVSLVCLPTVTRAAEPVAIPEAASGPQKFHGFVHYSKDRLTVRVRDVSGDELIQEVASQSGLTLVQHASLKESISIEFYRLSLPEGLRRILGEKGFVLEYAPRNSEKGQAGASKPESLWILARGDARYARQVVATEPSKQRSSRLGVALNDPDVLAALTSEDSWDRQEAVEALGKRRRRDAIGSLSLALHDGDDDVREAAIDALARIGGDEAAEAVAIALKDKNTSIREQAVEALAKIGGPEAVQALAIALRDEDSWLREDAVEALGAIGGEAAMRLAERALDDEDEFVRETAAELLDRAEAKSR